MNKGNSSFCLEQAASKRTNTSVNSMKTPCPNSRNEIEAEVFECDVCAKTFYSKKGYLKFIIIYVNFIIVI
jgi:hypothetical protein